MTEGTLVAAGNDSDVVHVGGTGGDILVQAESILAGKEETAKNLNNVDNSEGTNGEITAETSNVAHGRRGSKPPILLDIGAGGGAGGSGGSFSKYSPSNNNDAMISNASINATNNNNNNNNNNNDNHSSNGASEKRSPGLHSDAVSRCDQPQFPFSTRNLPHLQHRRSSVLQAVMGERVRTQGQPRRYLEAEKTQRQHLVLFTALVGVFFAGMANELVFRGVDPHSLSVQTLKVLVSISTFLLVILVWGYHKMCALITGLDSHVRCNHSIGTNDWLMYRPFKFFCEIVICCIHTPPFVSFPVTFTFMGIEATYDVEALLCLCMTLRFYHIFRLIKDKILLQYYAKHTISNVTTVAIDEKFAVKILLSDHPVSTILLGSSLVLFVSAYWLQLAERPVNTDQIYYWNSLWLMYVTMTTVGYGDLYPVSHLGRFVSAIAALFGIIASSLLTASLANSLSWTSVEHQALQYLDCERVRRAMRRNAAVLIQQWWRTRREFGRAAIKRMTRNRAGMVGSMIDFVSPSPARRLHVAEEDFRRTRIAAARTTQAFHLAGSVKLLLEYSNDMQRQINNLGSTVAASLHTLLDSHGQTRAKTSDLVSKVRICCSHLERVESWFVHQQQQQQQLALNNNKTPMGNSDSKEKIINHSSDEAAMLARGEDELTSPHKNGKAMMMMSNHIENGTTRFALVPPSPSEANPSLPGLCVPTSN